MVRDDAPGYGRRSRDRELLTGLAALRDVEVAEIAALPRLLARYAVLRAWLMRAQTSPTTLLEGARAAADAYLRPVEADWPEGRLLRRLLDRPGSSARCVRLLRSAAARATADGCPGSARALLGAAYIGAALGLDRRTAAGVAVELARSHESRGEAVEAALWRRRARGCAVDAGLWLPPSLS